MINNYIISDLIILFNLQEKHVKEVQQNKLNLSNAEDCEANS